MRQALRTLAHLTLLLGVAALPAWAVEEFEIEEPEVEEGEIEFQYIPHLFSGFPARESVQAGGKFWLDGHEVKRQAHYLEFGMAPTDWFRLSLASEFEEERLEEVGDFGDRDKFGSLKLTGIEGEFRVVLLPLEGDGSVVRLGDSGVRLPELAVVAEIDAAGGPGAADRLFRNRDEHYLGPVVYYSSGSGDDDEEEHAPAWTVGLGVLGGLGDGSSRLAIKLSLETEF